MDPIKQRIAIAESQGIHICPDCNHQIDPDCCHCGSPMNSHGYQDGHSGVPRGCTCGYDKADEMKAAEPECPDYLNDRNAMDPVEEYLTTLQLPTIAKACYLGWLNHILCGKGQPKMDTKQTFALLRASAAQRAEAFLRSQSLWTES